MTIKPAASKPTKKPTFTDIEVLAPVAPIPVGLLRSALFSVSLSGPYVDDKPIASEKDLLGISLTYSGPHLHQEHFKAWQAAIYLAQLNDGMTGNVISVSATDMLRVMGKSYRDHDQRKLLWRLLMDLQKASVSLSTNRSRYIGSLLMSASQDKLTGQLCIRMNPDLAHLLTNERLQNDMVRMVELGRDQLAIWLHNYYGSHMTPRPILVKELQRMCGTSLDLRRFRYRLKGAMEKLMGGVRPLILKFSIGEDDLVRVSKSKTQVKMMTLEEMEAAKNRFNKDTEAQKCRMARITSYL